MRLLKRGWSHSGEKRVVLHIGTHKTGSTAIQSYCFRYSDWLLREHSIHYPRALTKWHGHHPFAWALGVEHPHRDPSITLSRAKEAISDSFASSGAGTLLLSSEDFEFLADPSVALECFEEFDVEVIVYLRRQESFLISDFNQHVRMHDTRYSGSLASFIANHDLQPRFDYPRVLAPWIEALGIASLHVRSYEVAKASNLILDFLSEVGATGAHPEAEAGEDRTNVSLDPRCTDVLRDLNRRPAARGAHSRAVKLLRDASSAGILTDEFGAGLESADAEALRSFVSDFELSNKAIMGQFGQLRDPVSLGGIDYEQVVSDVLPRPVPLQDLYRALILWQCRRDSET